MGKTLRNIIGEELAGLALKGLVEKSKILEKGGVVDSVFMGSAIGATSAINPARWAVLASGLPESTSASYVEMQCGSAIDSINHAAWRILADQADIMIAGGLESYSQACARFSMAHGTLQDDSSDADCRIPFSHQGSGNHEHGIHGGSPAEDVQYFPSGPG